MTLGAARVRWTINDLSMFVDEVAMGYVTMVIVAERGPIARPKIVTSMDMYRRVFGNKVPYTTDPLVVEMALRQGAKLNVIRTAHYDNIADPTTLTALCSTATIGDRGDTATSGFIQSKVSPFVFTQSLSGRVTGSVTGPYVILNAGTIEAIAAAPTAGGTGYVLGDVLRISGGTGATVSVTSVNDGAVTGVSLIGGGSGYTVGSGVATTAATGTGSDCTVEITSLVRTDKFSYRVKTNGNWGEPATLTLTSGIERTASQVATELAAGSGINAAVTGNKVKVFADNLTDDLEILAVDGDCYSVLGFTESAYTHSVGTDILDIEIDGGSAQSFLLTPVNGLFRLTSAQVVAQLSTLAGATVVSSGGKVTITSLIHGVQSSVKVLSSSTATAVLGFDNVIHTGFSGSEAPTITFTSKNPGDWGDDVRVYITNNALNPLDEFDVRVVYLRDGTMSEWYPGLSMDPTDGKYFKNYINERSNLVVVEDEESENEVYSSDGWVNRPLVTTDLNGVALVGGTNGLEGFTDADWIGDGPNMTGMYAADMSYMSIDLMIPGTTSATVYQAMITYCENRTDMIAYGQVPYGLEPEDAVDWRLGNTPWSHPAFNSHRFTLFYGRPLVYDDMDDSRKYISCLGHLASCLAKTDNDYGYHFAPVGPRRGTVTLCEDVDFDVQGYRSVGYGDLFAEYGINYLMISHYAGIEGAMFWEQRTTLRRASALRELNVVRFITILNRMLMPVLRTFLFEPNHPVTWREIHRTLEPAFQDWKDKYAIYDFALQTDRDAWFDGGELKNAVINSGIDIDRGIYHCRALIQPTRTIYYLDFELGVLRTGEAFERYTELKELPGWVTK